MASGLSSSRRRCCSAPTSPRYSASPRTPSFTSRPASTTGPRQVEIFLEEGVAPEKIQIAHTGDTDDLDYIQQLLDKGVYIGLDRYGIDLFLPTPKRNATTLELLKRGHVERMFLSQDFVVALD